MGLRSEKGGTTPRGVGSPRHPPPATSGCGADRWTRTAGMREKKWRLRRRAVGGQKANFWKELGQVERRLSARSK